MMGTGGTLCVLRMTAPRHDNVTAPTSTPTTLTSENTPPAAKKSTASQQSQQPEVQRRLHPNSRSTPKSRIRKSYLCFFNRKTPMLQWNQLPSVIQTMLALILVLALGLCEAVISDDLVVSTTKGKIRGVTLKSATNK